MNYKSLRRVSIVLLMLILSLSVVGCKSTTPGINVVVEKDEPKVVVDNVTEKKYPIEIVDHLGRTIVFDKTAERIVSGYYITTSMLLSLGLKNNIVGLEAKPSSKPIYKIAAPELLDLPTVGTMKEFDLEGAVALNPDLIVVSVRLKDAVESMEKLGMKVIAVNPESTEQLNEALTMIAKATGHEENAQKLIQYNNEKTVMIKELVKDKAKKNVYLGGNNALLSTATNKMYQHTLIEIAGGNNVSGDIDDTYWADISYEQLIAYNPEIIVATPDASYSKDDIMKDDRLKGIKAVENNNVYFMPSNFENWDSPMSSGILGTLWLTSILHEDLYSFDEFKEDVFNFYKEFYGVEINKDDITK